MKTRSASVLIVIAGIAAMLATLAMAFFIKVRSEASKSRVLIMEAQARVMLNAALTYLQESSRLGWGSEGYGWIDIRDGSLGPRGPVAADGSLPVPAWWKASYGAYPPGPAFPGSTAVTWPAPGATMRGDLYAWTRPPHAIEMTYAYNPVPYDPDQAVGITVTGWKPDEWNDKELVKFRFIRNAYGLPGAKGALQPQPVSANRTAFIDGDPTPVTGSDGLGWFRCYRETAVERDNDGTPWYDHVAFPANQWSTFVITCAAGATRGFRDWAEVLAEGASAQFNGDAALFAELRREERLLWYRVEWCANTGGVFDPVNTHFDNSGQYHMKTSQRVNTSEPMGGLQTRNFTGTYRFIQRLDREPPRW